MYTEITPLPFLPSSEMEKFKKNGHQDWRLGSFNKAH